MTGPASISRTGAMTAAHEVDVIFGCEAEDLPEEQEFIRWALAALAGEGPSALSIRLVGEAEARALNHDYRQRDYATNVLSFPTELPEAVLAELDRRPLGDLAICMPVVTGEAREQGKPVARHLAHLTVHGVLHLLGYDHESAQEAELMEGREREILAGLGMPDPYA